MRLKQVGPARGRDLSADSMPRGTRLSRPIQNAQQCIVHSISPLYATPHTNAQRTPIYPFSHSSQPMNFEDTSKKVITSFTPYLDLMLLAVKWSNPLSDWDDVSRLIGESQGVHIPAQMCQSRFEGHLGLIFGSECLLLLRGKVATPGDFVWLYREMVEANSAVNREASLDQSKEDLQTVDHSQKDALLKMEEKNQTAAQMVKLEGQPRKSIGRMWIDLTDE